MTEVDQEARDDAYEKWLEVEQTLRIEEVLDELGVYSTHVRGDEWFAHCPLPTHSGADRNPSFSINLDSFKFSCFTCATGGTAIRLAMQILDIDYIAAVDWLAGFSDYAPYDDVSFLDSVRRKLAADDERPMEREDDPLPWYPTARVSEWSANLLDDDSFWVDCSLILDGRDRMIDHEVARHLQLGYDPEHHRGSHVGPALIIPVFAEGHCVGWQERWLGDRPDWVPKYTNTTDFPRNETLYNGQMLHTKRAIVVESPMTVGRLLTAGYASMATFGAQVSDDQIRLLRRVPEVWVSYDNDKAGKDATRRIVDALSEHSEVWVVLPPEIEKGDLGDCDDALLEETLANRLPGLLFESGL